MAFLGAVFVLAEYAAGVVLSLALGTFVLIRGASSWQLALGAYFICLGFNYIPMLTWAIAIRNPQNARSELGDELVDKAKAMAKYRRQSLVLLIPIVPLVLAIRGKQRDKRPDSTTI